MWGTPISEWASPDGTTFRGYSTNGITVVKITAPTSMEIRYRQIYDVLTTNAITLFGRFNTGWIPSKGHPGLQVDHEHPDHNAHRPRPLDLRRIIKIVLTPRRMCDP